MHSTLYMLHVGACRENGGDMAERDWMLWFDDMEKGWVWVRLCINVCERISFHCRPLGFFYNKFWVQGLL